MYYENNGRSLRIRRIIMHFKILFALVTVGGKWCSKDAASRRSILTVPFTGSVFHKRRGKCKRFSHQVMLYLLATTNRRVLTF
jgi:hypothetical protein